MTKVLMCCSSLDTKGGMVSVVKNYLDYKEWGDFSIKFIPTHFDTNKYLLIAYFAIRFIQIWFIVKTQRIDIAHLHVAERGSFWRKAFLLRFFHRNEIKVILHHHGAEFESFYNDCSKVNKNKIKNVLGEADVNIVLSERLISMITSKSPEAKVKVLYNSVYCKDKNPYRSQADKVLFLGRLGKRKGVFDLLKAIKRIDTQIPDNIKFYLCGDQGEQQVYDAVKNLNIEHRIEHIGWIDQEMKEKIIPHVMINCLPSYNEGLPMTILETMAAGIPNISTAIASIPEVIKDGVNGFLIQPGDIDALSEKLLTLINDKILRERFSNSSYETVLNNFSIDKHIMKLKDIYSNCNK